MVHPPKPTACVWMGSLLVDYSLPRIPSTQVANVSGKLDTYQKGDLMCKDTFKISKSKYTQTGGQELLRCKILRTLFGIMLLILGTNKEMCSYIFFAVQFTFYKQVAGVQGQTVACCITCRSSSSPSIVISFWPHRRSWLNNGIPVIRN